MSARRKTARSKFRAWPGLFLFVLVIPFLLQSCGERGPKKTYKIARDPTWYPLNLYGREDNLLGFIDDLLATIAKEKSLKIDLVYTTSSTIFIGLNRDEFDAAVTSRSPLDISDDYFIFSDPLYLLGFVLVIQENSTVDSIKDLQEKIIGIERGSIAAFDTVRYPTVVIEPYDSINIALDRLAQGRINAVLLDAIPAFIFTHGVYRGQLKIATQPLTDLGLRLIADKTQDGQEFVKLVNEGLKTIKENGVYKSLCMKWGIYDPFRFRAKIPHFEEKDNHQ